MKTQPIGSNTAQTNIEQRMRTVRTLWLAITMSLVMYYVFTRVAGRPENAQPNPQLSLALLVVAVATTLVSFVIKNKLVGKAIEQRQVQHVQQGYLVAWVVTEIAALLGLVDFFTTSHAHFYVPLIIAAIGQLLHFPRREHFERAALAPGSPNF
jgi:magnesium-transporting ATPase (P-type)